MEGPASIRGIGLLVFSGLTAGSLWLAGALQAQDVPAEENPFASRPSEPAVTPDWSQSPVAAPAARSKGTDVNKRRVSDWMRQARKALDEGDREAAALAASKAEKLARDFKIAFRANEQSPTQLLAEIRRAPGDAVLAESRPAGSSPFAAANAQPVNPQAPSEDFLAGFSPEAAPAPVVRKPVPVDTPETPEQKLEQATSLLVAAQEKCAKGHYEEAQSLVQEARGIEATYGAFDTTPDQVQAEIERQSGVKFIAARPSADWANTPSDPTRDQAVQLLVEARQLLSEGKLDEAKAKAEEAAALNATFTAVDDRPELVLQDVDSHSQSFGGAATAEAPAQFAAADTKHKQALGLLNSARQALQSGDVATAEAKAAEAEALEVAYDTFDDRPEQVRDEIKRVIALRSQPKSDTQLAGRSPAKRDRSVVNLSGLSAKELYQQGVQHLRSGDREAAYQAFVAIKQSGERLDAHKEQQLQDWLRDLAPRRDVRLASGEESGAPWPDAPLSPLDRADVEMQVKFDKVRTEMLNAVFMAGRMRDNKPEQALELLDQQIATIESAGLTEVQTKSLLAQVRQNRASIESDAKMKKPIRDQERKNAEVKDGLKRDMELRVKVEQETAKLVDEFNDLIDQRRFPEAHAKALQARELNPTEPAIVAMVEKSRIMMYDARNKEYKEGKEAGFIGALGDVEASLAFNRVDDAHPMIFDKDWEAIIKRREGTPTDSVPYTEAEQQIRKSLNETISLHFDSAPLAEVIQHIADQRGINATLDQVALEDENVSTSTLVRINVDGIRLKSALNTLLEPLNLGYTIKDEQLFITSKLKQQGDLKIKTYSVADLVIPISVPNPTAILQPGTGYGPAVGGGAISGYPQIPNGIDPVTGLELGGGVAAPTPQPNQTNADFHSLMQLITTAIEPASWAESGGQASIESHDSTLSLIIRQTQRGHEEIADLLDQLRRLQTLQVTVEVRFITVSDDFFEQIGVDFDFNVNDTVGGPIVDNQFNPILPFGSTDPLNGFQGVSTGQQGQGGGQQGGGQQGGGQQGGGQQGQQGQQGGGNSFIGLATPFGQGPTLNLLGRDSWASPTIVGLSNNDPLQFQGDLDIPFRQGSFALGTPPFGNPQQTAGIQFGMAILSDLEAFLFVRAAQGDRRSNIMFAPKITLFNGVPGFVFSGLQQPFVVSVTPVVGTFSVGFQPVVVTFTEGVSLGVQAVVSADRRYVRLGIAPVFSNITDVFTFSFFGGGNGGGIGGQQGIGQNGGGAGGQAGGVTGGQQGGGGGQQQQGGGGQQGQQGQQGQGAAVGQITVQQPVFDSVRVGTVVSVPDGGTVLLGGVKTLREGRSMAGVPILNKIPYVSRLFKNTGVGRETQSLMLMVTPRIIIQEEEEQLLGIAEGP